MATTFRQLLYILTVVLLSAAATGCTPENDIEGIFVGRTWKLSYFCTVDGDDWKHDVKPLMTQEEMKSVNTAGKYQITFHDGTFSGIAYDTTFSGRWEAEGDSYDFKLTITESSGQEQDETGRKFLDSLKKARYYLGDYNSVKIFYDEKKNFLLFRPLD